MSVPGGKGPHAGSTYALWHDPTVYDPILHGPPYLPEGKSPSVKMASNRKAVKDAVRPMVQKIAADEMTEIVSVVQHIQEDYGSTPMSEMAALLAFIQAAGVVHQSHHWQTRGETSYGDHLLFERIYKDTVAMVDGLAERMIGSGHYVLAHPILLAKNCSLVVRSFYRDAGANPSADIYPVLSIRAVLRTILALKIVHSALEKRGLLSHGIDSLLQGMADKHEEFVYLLKQRAQAKTAFVGRSAGDTRWKAG